MLTAKREKFAQECAAGKTATDAYRAAFTVGKMKDQTLWEQASRIYKIPEVRARITELKGKVEQAVVVTMAEARDLVLRDCLDVINADPTELITHRRLNCRYCHGIGHAYRWRDDGEFWAELARVGNVIEAWDPKRGRPPELPVDDGGYGFRRLHPPSMDCPQCEGEGIEETRVADIRTVGGPARRLFQSVKVKKDGSIEVVMRDKEAARATLAKWAGMLVDVKQVQGSLGIYPDTPPQLSPEQAAAVARELGNKI